jgi:glycerol-3-phosphate dehydrogenase
VPDLETGVVVIGGGSTGASVLRDLALRGIEAILVEKGDLASGTTGRSHGLLHSGGRYCVTDVKTAAECAAEGRILRRIAPEAIEDTGGYFISVSESDREWEPRFVDGCQQAGITCEPISVEETRRREPALSTDVRSAFWIPQDGQLDPSALVMHTVQSARRHGAQVRSHHEVAGFLRDGEKVLGVRLRENLSGEESTIGCQAVINATGAWAGQVAALFGVQVRVAPEKGTMVVLSRRVAHAVINRCHPPGDGDIIAPAGSVSILGTTAIRVPSPDDLVIGDDEILSLVDEASLMLSGLDTVGMVRAYAGVRPLYDPSGEAAGRHLSRDFTVIDHQHRDGIAGVATIVGGKVTTSRLMAEAVVDLVAGWLGVRTPCRTAEVRLSD